MPVAVGLLVAGAVLARERDAEPLGLPWIRVLALELAAVSSLAILAATVGPAGPGEAGPGGEVGWALNTLTSSVLGPLPAALVWMAVLAVGAATALGYPLSELVAGLVGLAERAEPNVDSPRKDAPPRDGAQRAEPSSQSAATAAGDPSREAAGKTGRRRPEAVRSPRKATRKAKPHAATSSALKRHLPPYSLLGEEAEGEAEEAGLQALAERIERTLQSFGVPAEVVDIERGPAVTRFGLKPGVVERGGNTRRVPVARITARRDDLALALSAQSLRIEAPVPGRPVVGIEIPNPESHIVAIRGVVEDRAFIRSGRQSSLTAALGRDVTGQPVVADIARMPHLLIGGATGSGKSMCLHSIVVSLLLQNTPDMLRMVMVDPKRVEFARYRKLPHLVGPVVTELPAVIAVLRWVEKEMDHRYRRFAEKRVRDIAGYNAKSPAGEAPLPWLVVIVDELADPMLVAPEDTEPLVQRLAQLGRATGIHLVVATQRPSTDVVTGIIKANFPARIAFAVASSVDSRVILDRQGAETLLGAGDMLFQSPEDRQPKRVQGAFLAEAEIDAVVKHWKDSPWSRPAGEAPWADLIRPLDPDERLLAAARELAGDEGELNVSLLQRRLHIGHAKASSILERLQREAGAGDDADPDS